MNKCPRCENENLKEHYNYCPVCGVNLGTAPEVPVQEQYVNLKIGSKEIAKVVIDEINKQQKQVTKTLII
ncbi:hypothetical protein POG14_05190 [Clostridium paraputrificum]|uniref:hypothetical protein n=1 Tax=Clostridium paraputrificum TaxID=29363 RepID=UPI001896C553|nr:hypothetical protein [Clostridium paraputrificum]MDC0801570.1 hypothetical protein [Clostridium paraputrificum]